MGNRLLLCAVLFAACSNNNVSLDNETLTRVTAATTAECPFGGVSIGTGIDRNGNGVLDDYEILSSYNICNPAPVMPLQTYPSNATPPTSPAGAFTIDLSGGGGSAPSNSGGAGGQLSLNNQQGTLGGQLAIFTTGSVDASFTLPTATFDGGDVLLTATADTTLASYPSPADGVVSGDAFFAVDQTSVLYANVGGVATPVTGIDVAASVTLTFALNDAAVEQSTIVVAHDIRNAGTITTATRADGVSSGWLSMSAADYIGLAGSAIALAGTDAPGAHGGDAGALTITFQGTFLNQGPVHASGGSGDQGGNGGNITIISSQHGARIFNTASIDSVGGAGAATTCGGGGFIEMQLKSGELNNSGNLLASGGAGLGDGGNGGQVTLELSGAGNVRNSGNLSANGGSCTNSGCFGGAGTLVSISTEGGGDVLNSGDIDISGGDAGSAGGGAGGQMSIDNEDEVGAIADNVGLPTGSVQCSGTINVHGGSSVSGLGGTGGAVYIDLNVDTVPMGQQILLLGYTEINLDGGAGSAGAAGGNGGSMTVEQGGSAHFPGGGSPGYGPAGAAINYANVVARGGAGVTGGSGGVISLRTQDDTNFNDAFEIAANFGDIDVGGGTSTSAGNSGGDAGVFQLNGIAGTQTMGALLGVGGSASGASSAGGGGGYFGFFSDAGAVQNAASITDDGGQGTSIGGVGGTVELLGVTVNNSKAISCDGGAGADLGGDGGAIHLFSSMGPSVNSGTLSVAGGAATVAGNGGTVLVDGIVTGS